MCMIKKKNILEINNKNYYLNKILFKLIIKTNINKTIV